MTTCRVADCGATTDAFCCRSCAAELRRALQNHHRGDPDVPTLMAALSQSATGSARVYRANRRPGQPDEELAELEEAIGWQHDATPARLRSKQGRITLPATGGVVNLAARDLLDEAWSALTTTVRHLLEHRGVDNPFTPDSTPRQVADWLADRVNAIRYDDAGPDIHADLIRLRERLIRAVDRGPSRIYSGPCDRTTVDDEGRATTCHRPLYAWINVWAKREHDDEDDEDDRTIVCDGHRLPTDPEPPDKGCGAEHTAKDRQAWLFAELEYRLEPIKWWSYWLPLVMRGDLRVDVPRPVVESWAESQPGRVGKPDVPPRLRARTITAEAVELFAGGEVMDLMRQYRPRAYAARPNRGRMSA